MEGLQMRYFVLKPKGNDRYAEASRKAMRAYATHIESVNREMAIQLRQWADSEHTKVLMEEDSDEGLKDCTNIKYHSTEELTPKKKEQ